MPNAEPVQTTTTERPRGPERRTRRDGVAGDEVVDERFEEIGLTPRTGWYTSIALYLVGSIPAIALPLIAPEAFPRELLWLGVLALLMVPLSYVGLKLYPNSVRATHLRLGVGLVIQTVGAVSIGDALQAFAMLPLLTILPPAIYFGVTEGMVYLLLGDAIVAAIMLSLNEPWAWALAVCATTAIATLSISMMVAQSRTRRIAREHRKLAYTDPLTGVANARALHERLAAEVRAVAAGGSRAALFAIDLDNFKSVNDELGYAAGDRLLVATAEALERSAADGDLVARRGGDEFSVVVSDADEHGFDRMKQALAGAIVDVRRWSCPDVTPTASVGFVSLRADDTISSALERADDELHERKTEFHAHDTAVRPRRTVLDERRESERTGVEQDAFVESYSSGDDEVGGESLVEWLRGTRPIDRPTWTVAASMQVVIGVTLAVIAALSLAPGFGLGDGLAFGGAMLVAAAVSAAAAGFLLTRRLVHLTYAASIAILVLAVVSAGDSGAGMLELFAILALFAFHLFGRRTAITYLLVTVAAYGYLSIAGGFPYAEARLSVFAIMMLACATLFGKVRTVTSRFLKQNWEFSQRDALTGVANVRALRARLRDVTKQTRRRKPPVALIAVDLDEFKQVNDRFNHSTGDATLVAVARAIEDNVRSDDLVARRGGDEFVVVVQGTERRERQETLDRIARSIVRVRSRICPGLAAGASVVWVDGGAGDDADSLLGRADQALHDRKIQLRRDRINAVA